MATTAEMQAQLDNLRDMRARGVRKYEIAGRSMEYKSDMELASAIADLERRISAASGTPVRHIHFNSSKGL